MGTAAELDALRWRHEADRLLGRDDARGALLTYDKALALDPFVYACWLGKGKALEALGNDDAALDRYDIAASLAGSDSSGMMTLSIQAGVRAPSSISSPPPACTTGCALSACSPLPIGSGT